MSKKIVKAYIVVLEDGRTVLRYLCASCAKEIIYWWKRGFKLRFVTIIHSDVYDKKCHMCRRK